MVKQKKILLSLLGAVCISFSVQAKVQHGTASFYHDKFNGRKTANGEVFNNKNMTAAHRTLPIGSKVRVTNLKNHKSVVVRINDRGPYVKRRILDLSKAGAKKLDMEKTGIATVKVEILEKP